MKADLPVHETPSAPELPLRQIPTDSDLPMPDVTLVQGDNLKLADLKGDELETWITYPGIAVGHVVAPNFRGRAKDGSSVDELVDEKVILHLENNKFKLEIPNGTLQQLSGGQVFYSFYKVKDSTLLAHSLRRFFFVDKADEGGGDAGLPVLQLQQSHELKVDLKALGSADALLAVVPYQAMAIGDRITFFYQAFLEGFSDPFVDWSLTVTVTEEQVGKAILATLPNGVLRSVEGLNGEMHYRIAYSDGGEETASPIQSNFPVAQVLPAPDLLEPPVIKGLVGDTLDPDEWPDGIIVQVPFRDEMRVGAGVVLYIDSVQPSIEAVRVDPSSADSKRLEFHLSQQWLRDRRDQDIEFSYQFGVVGQDGRSETLTLAVQANLMLEPASVKDAVPDEDEPGRSVVSGWAIREGTEIILPGDQDLPADPEYTVYWDGYRKFTSSGPIGNSLRYAVPKGYVAENLGKYVRVYYDVKFGDSKAYPSPDHHVFITDLAKTSWSTITTPNFGSSFTLESVGEQGLPLLLRNWLFMDEGQKVHIEVFAKVGGVNKKFVIRDAMEVTKDESAVGRIEAAFSKSDLASIDLNSTFDITVSVSFDGGQTFKDFPAIQKKLVSKTSVA